MITLFAGIVHADQRAFLSCGDPGRSGSFKNVLTIFQHADDVVEACPYCRNLQLVYDDKSYESFSPYANQVFITVLDPDLTEPLAQVQRDLTPLWNDPMAPSVGRLNINFESVAPSLARLNVQLTFVGPSCEDEAPECDQLVVKDVCSTMASSLFELIPQFSYPNSPLFP
ncbi:hypothetical protein GW915_04495 [bacterium]|nr:hypothetical protein [bacterium]